MLGSIIQGPYKRGQLWSPMKHWLAFIRFSYVYKWVHVYNRIHFIFSHNIKQKMCSFTFLLCNYLVLLGALSTSIYIKIHCASTFIYFTTAWRVFYIVLSLLKSTEVHICGPHIFSWKFCDLSSQMWKYFTLNLTC